MNKKQQYSQTTDRAAQHYHEGVCTFLIRKLGRCGHKPKQQGANKDQGDANRLRVLWRNHPQAFSCLHKEQDKDRTDNASKLCREFIKKTDRIAPLASRV